MKQSFLRRVLSVLLCVSLLLGVSVVRSQKAEAFAISASLVASVIMIMTACGVTFWASTQGDAESYISQKLGEFLDQLNPSPASVLDWLGIDDLGQLFVVLSGGIVRFDSNVANPILSFVRWFNQSEGVTSDGSSVDNAVPIAFTETITDSYTGTVSAEIIDANRLRFNLSEFAQTSGTPAFYVLNLGAIGAIGTRYQISVDNAVLSWQDGSSHNCYVKTYSADSASYLRPNSSYMSRVSEHPTLSFTPSSGSPCLCICLRQDSYSYLSGFVDFLFNAPLLLSPSTAAVSPSDSVAVPEDVDQGESFDVAPSVPLTEGMSVEDASSEIFDGVTSADGLTSTGEAVEPPALDLSGILEILGSILNAILAIPGHIAALPSAIASAFSSLLTSIKSVLDSIADWVASIAQTVLGLSEAIGQAAGQAAQDVITGIHSLPGMISDALVNLFVPDEAYIGEFVASLHGIFDNRFSILSYPFSILGEFITRASGIDEDEPILRWPDIYEPFSGQLLIGAGSYNLNQIRQGNFAQAHGLYMVVVKGWIAFEFLGYLYSWFCSVFKMREDDFVSPLEAYDGGDDG